jgi:uncharacterized membrane protein YphA (DoxX/SURF4 family)
VVRVIDKRYVIGLAACILLGLTLLASGIGKLFMNLPNETEFIQQLSPVFMMSPDMASMFAYILPWAEVFTGLLLLLQIFPALTATLLCVPLIIGFMLNNIWMISQGAVYEKCNYCFGQLEVLLGSLTPWQSLYIDLVMFGLACLIVFIGTRYRMLYGIGEGK